MAKSAEFILDYESKQVLVLEPFGPYYEEAIQRLGEQPDLQVVECGSLREMAGLARNVGVCVVLCHCPDETFAPEFVSLLQTLRGEIRERKIRVVITVSRDYLILQPKFIREGANEVVPQPITPKQLYLKIDRYLDILPSRDSRGKIVPPKSRDKMAASDLSDEPQITWHVPLKIRSDCWTTIEGRTRWLSGPRKWSVALIGPPPQFGEWAASDRMPGRAPEPEEPTWEWIPSGLTDDPFIQEDGAWKFRGDKPEFKNGAWVFTGRHPQLTFVRKDDDHGSKVAGDPRELGIAEDSEQARKAAEIIEQALRDGTFQFEIPIEQEVAPEFGKVSEAIMETGDSGSSEAPGYLKRLPHEEQEHKARPILTVNPVAAGFLVSELILNRGTPPEKILGKFLEYLKLACGGGQIELWLHHDGLWKCVQHDDLMDMALAQKLEQLIPDPSRDTIAHTEAQRAVLIYQGREKLGALVLAKGTQPNADIFTDLEIKGFAKVLTGMLVGMRRLDYLQAAG